MVVSPSSRGGNGREAAAATSAIAIRDKAQPTIVTGLLAAGQTLGAGAVLGEMPRGKQGQKCFTQIASAGGDGTEFAAGILLESVDASERDTACTVMTRGTYDPDLIWPQGFSDKQRVQAVAQLADCGILCQSI